MHYTFKKAIVVILTFIFLTAQVSIARNSSFTQKGTGPLCWSTYGMQYDPKDPHAFIFNEATLYANINRR